MPTNDLEMEFDVNSLTDATEDFNGTIEVVTYPTNDGTDDLTGSVEIMVPLSLNHLDYTNHLAGGNNHTSFRWFDGSLSTVGSDANGEITNTPTGTTFTQVTAGDGFSLALDTGGITGWGNITGVPTGTNFVQVDAGDTYGLALTQDGHVEGFGNNPIINDLPIHGGIVQVAAGHSFVLLLMYDGTLEGVGITPPAGEFIDISAGKDHGAALGVDGTITSFGDDTWNQITNTPATNNFTSVECGADFTIAINTSDKLEVWGRDNYSQVIGAPSYAEAVFSEVTGGFEHGFAMAPDGTLAMRDSSFGWGRNDFGQVSTAPDYIGEDTYVFRATIIATNVTINPQTVEALSPSDSNFSCTLVEQDGNPVKVRYTIYLNDTVYKESTYLNDLPMQINETFLYEELEWGINEIRITVSSDSELMNEYVGMWQITKINNPATEVTFSEDLIARSTLIKAVHANEIINLVDEDLGRRDLAAGCNSGCTGNCQGCTAQCTGGCTGTCDAGCTSGCTGGCSGSCSGGCSGCDLRWF